MSAAVGVLRVAEGLADATALIEKLAGHPAEQIDQDSWETTNLVTISSRARRLPRRSARRPAARTGATTSPSAMTPVGRGTSTSTMTDGIDHGDVPCRHPPTDPALRHRSPRMSSP